MYYIEGVSSTPQFIDNGKNTHATLRDKICDSLYRQRCIRATATDKKEVPQNGTLARNEKTRNQNH